MTKKIDYRNYEELETEAEIIFMECDNGSCSWSSTDGVEETSCPDCGGDDLIPETSIEGTDCDACGMIFDMWDSCHYVKFGCSGTAICLHCYREMKKESVGL